MLSGIQNFGNLQLLNTRSCTCNNQTSDIFESLLSNMLQVVRQQQKTQILSEINEQLQSYIENNNYNQNISITTDSGNNILISTSNSNNVSNEGISNISSKLKSSNSEIENAIKYASKKYNVDEKLIRSVIKIESNFNPNTKSRAGAIGLMQIIPQNYSYLGITDPYDIKQNIEGGTKELRDLLNRFDNDVEMALMGYNGGIGRMAQRGVKSSGDLYKMPKETQNYVPKVMELYKG